MGAVASGVVAHLGRSFDGLVRVTGICFEIVGAISLEEGSTRFKETWET